MSRTGTGMTRLPSLTGFRFILFLAVFSCHALTSAQFYSLNFLNHLGVIAPYAVGAVSCFFVLSGFVLAWSAQAPDQLKYFWRRRIVRILPSHLITWAMTILVFVAVGGALPLLGPPPLLGPAFANLFLIHSWIPSPEYALSVNGVNWSVSCEIFFYALFPFWLWMVKLIPSNRLWQSFVVTALSIFAVPGIVSMVIHGPPWSLWPPLSFMQTWLVLLAPPVRVLEFILGILLARIVQANLCPHLRLRWVGLFIFLVWSGTLILPTAYTRSGIFAVPLGLLIAVIASRDIHGRPSWLRHRFMVLLGDATYAMYLVHFLLLAMARYLIGRRTFNAVDGTLIIIAVFTAAQFAGLVLYLYVERPLMRKLSVPRRQRKALGAAANQEGGTD